MNRPIAILGAGPAGLAAALSLGANATVFEASAHVAGLSRSLELDGAVFDLGGHSFHSPHAHVRDLVYDAVEMEEQPRAAWCWTRGDWIAYPFQKHVGAISDRRVREACIEGMQAAGDGRDALDFDDFIDKRFGRAVAAAFMRPYNRKLWGDDLTRLTTSWTGERLAGPLGTDERFDNGGGQRTPLQADTTIGYPKKGGFGTIFEALSRRIADLRLDTAIAKIDPDSRTLTTVSGDRCRWEHVVSTVPLPALLSIISGVPGALRDSVATLEAIPVDLVMVVLEGRGPTDRQRVYCPDPGIPGHKIVLNHTSSRWLRGLPRHGIQVEVSGAREHGADLAYKVIDSLVRLGLVSRGEVRRVERLRLPLGYPAPTHARDCVIRDVRAWLAERRIHICGRFAEWAYINADEALARGLALGARLAAGHDGASRGRA